jgi:DNA-binding CsgD family transcriptional regulator
MARARDKQRGIIVQRQIDALELRKAGYTFREIAARLSVSLGTAAHDVQAELKRLAAIRLDNAEELRQLELDRIDIAVKGLLPFVQSGSATHASTLLKCIEQRSKLLGLYAPEKYTIQWQEEAVASIKAGEVDYEPLAEEFGIDLATQLFAMAGTPISTVSTCPEQNSPPAHNGNGCG